MLRFDLLASGSEANSYLLQVGETKLLIDAGLSSAQTEKRLSAIGHNFRDLNGILLTHRHQDHASGLKVMTSTYHKTIYASPGTIDELDPELRGTAPHYVAVEPGKVFSIGKIDGYAFPVQHDAAQPIGFVLQGEGIRVGITTDLGALDTVEILNAFPSCDLILTESNHDPEILAVGPYPPFLKARVLREHLSNQDTCSFIRNYLTNKTDTLILGHISRNNNDPRLVRLMATKALAGRSTKLVIAEPNKQLSPIVF